MAEIKRQDQLPAGHVVLEQAELKDGRVSQTVRRSNGTEYERIVDSEEAYEVDDDGDESHPTKDELAAIGQSVFNWIGVLAMQDGPLKDWSPAEDPTEIIPDLYNMLEESLACHRQACGETQQLAGKMLELTEAIETELEVIGADDPISLAVLREAVKIAKDVKTGRPIASLPRGFCWINQPITVTGGDYIYEGQLLCSFPKDEDSSAVRYIVRDQNRRLFIHNAQQCGLEAKI